MNSNDPRHAPWFLSALLLLAITASSAVSAQKRAPVEVAADTAEYDEEAKTMTYSGNVVVTQAETWIKCAKLTVYEAGETDSEGQLIVAEGAPVQLQQKSPNDGKEVTGRASRAEYDLDKRLLTLIGDAELIQQGDRVSSDRILYDMTTSVAKAGGAAQGQERVRTLIRPRQ